MRSRMFVSHRSYLTRLCIFLLSTYPSKSQRIQTPDFESDWFTMESRSSTDSFKVIRHNIGEAPEKVKVLVRPTNGIFADWMFEATSSQQADDDLPIPYCGILYVYSDTDVFLYAPIQSNNYPTGRAFCIDSSSWTSGSGSTTANQMEDKVLVKVIAWRSSAFPVPDLVTDWIHIAAREWPNFREVAHNLGEEPSLIHLQIRCTPSGSEDFIYTEGVGAGNGGRKVWSDISGLVFGYNESHVRVWSPNNLTDSSHIICTKDGYTKQYCCDEGEFRLTAWLTIGQETNFTFYLNDTRNNSIVDMSAVLPNLRQWDPLHDYISIQVKALDGPNSGFIFPAIGQENRAAYRDISYGGVVFGYSMANIRIFVPADLPGTIIHLSDFWGNGEYNQMSNSVRIAIRIWSTAPNNTSCNGRHRSATFLQKASTDCPIELFTICVPLCLSEVSCAGVKTCSGDEQCEFLEVTTVNNMALKGTLATEGIVFLTSFTCQ